MISIAIDGPSGSGKSSIAKRLAEALDMTHLDTGAMYRSLAYVAKEQHIEYHDEKSLVNLLRTMNYTISEGELMLNQHPLPEEIRDAEFSTAASQVSVHPGVRTMMQEKQRDLAKCYPIIMDGRDIGAFVLPDAQFKFFITAVVEERARRRHKQEEASGISYDEVLRQLVERDQNDRTRAVAPLTRAEDAIVIDNTHLVIDETIQMILDRVGDRK